MPSFMRSLNCGLTAAAVVTVSLATAAPASARDQAFFNAVAGSWKGPGEIVAGKYKGTRFVCDFAGDPLAGGKTGINLDGACRVGVFSEKMTAVISQTRHGYTGRFLDGADGKGLDVTAGDVRDNKVVVAIHRKQLFGAMVASLNDPNTMNITVSVRVGEKLIPVIGMTLTRALDHTEVGSID